VRARWRQAFSAGILFLASRVYDECAEQVTLARPMTPTGELTMTK